ncbi:MAG: SAM-dependent methyltransferase [Deltaproteobacteria bacterium]|jgi:predicted methyltransferase|nr:SAM-dependent methyltransferase [Deltaproteobacteria bacterium]
MASIDRPIRDHHARRRGPALLAVLLLLITGGCGWLKRQAYEGGDRDSWQQPEKVVAALALAPNAEVADLGAGGGYFTFRLADAVPQGRVYAVDVDEDMTRYLEERSVEEGRRNVTVVLAEPEDAGLPGQVDWVFTCNTFHHLPDQAAYFERLKASLAPGGRVAIVEYVPEEGFSLLGDHATGEDSIRAAMEQAGYELEADHSFLARQSFLVFAPRP